MPKAFTFADQCFDGWRSIFKILVLNPITACTEFQQNKHYGFSNKRSIILGHWSYHCMLSIKDIVAVKSGLLTSNDKVPLTAHQKAALNFAYRLIQIIECNYQNPKLNRKKIASMMAVSDRQLQRKLKTIIGQNPMELLRTYRLNVAKEKLKGGYKVSQITDECGFNSVSYFSQSFKAKFGVSPKQYQQSAKSGTR